MLREARDTRVAKLAGILKIAAGELPADYATAEGRQAMEGRAHAALRKAGWVDGKPPAAPSPVATRKVPHQKTGAELTKIARGQLLGKVVNAARGAIGAAPTQAVTQAQQAVGRARQGVKLHGQRMLGQRVVAGSPQHKVLQQAGAQFRPTGNTVAMQGGVPVRPTLKNLEALRSGPGNTGGQVDANITAMMSKRRMNPGRPFQRIQDPGQARLPLQLRMQQFRAQQAAQGAAPLQQAHTFGKDVLNPALKSTAKGVGLVGGIGAGTTAATLGGLNALSPAKQAAVRKLAGRIINADVGLEDIIAHIKAARAKKAAQA
jgi:hypothetical protein